MGNEFTSLLSKYELSKYDEVVCLMSHAIFFKISNFIL